MRWKIGAVAMTAGLFIGVQSAHAQPEDSAPEAEAPGHESPQGLASATPVVSLGGTPVPLSALLEHALEHAPELAVAEAEVGLARAEFGAAAPALPDNPSLLVALGPHRDATGASALDLNLQLMQPVEIGGQRRRRRGVARAARTTYETRLRRARWRVHQQIHAGYRRALAARRGAEIALRLTDFATRLAEIAQRRVDAGDASPLIARLAQADAAQASQRAVAAMLAYRDACLSLAQVAGWSATSPPEPMGELPRPRAARGLTELTAMAREHNPELEVRRAVVREAQLRVDLADRDAWPDPSFGVQYGYEGGLGGGPAEHVVLGVVQVSIPAFALNQEARARTSAERDVAEARRDLLSSVLEVRLERLRSAVNASAARVESFGADILPRFEENLSLLRLAFELGEIDLLRVSVALERFLAVQQQALDAYVDYFAAAAALEAEVGEEFSEHEGHAL